MKRFDCLFIVLFILLMDFEKYESLILKARKVENIRIE